MLPTVTIGGPDDAVPRANKLTMSCGDKLEGTIPCLKERLNAREPETFANKREMVSRETYLSIYIVPGSQLGQATTLE